MNFTFSKKTILLLAASILMAATNALAQDEPTLFDPETLLGDNPFAPGEESPIADGEQQGIFRYEGGGFYSYEYYTRPSIAGLARSNMRVAVPAFYSTLAIPQTASPVEIIEAVPDNDEQDLYCRRPGVWNSSMNSYAVGDGPYPTLILANWNTMDENIETEPSVFSPDDFDTRVASAFLKNGYTVCQIYTRDGLTGGNLTDENFDLLVKDSKTAVKKISQLPYVDEDSIVLFGRSGRADTVLELASQINDENDGFEIAHLGLWEPAVLLFTDILAEKNDNRLSNYPLNDRSHFINCYYNGINAVINKNKFGVPFESHTVECAQKMIRQNTQTKIAEIEARIYVAAGGIDVASFTPVLTLASGGTSRTTVYPISDALIPDLIAAEKDLRLGLFGDLPHSPVYFTIDEAIQSYNEILNLADPGYIMTDVPDNIDEYYATAWTAAQYYRFITDFKTQTNRSVKTKPIAWLED